MVAAGIETLGEEGEGGALPATALGHQQGDGVSGEGEAEFLEDLLQGRVAQQGSFGDGLGERRQCQFEVLFECHGFLSPL